MSTALAAQVEKPHRPMSKMSYKIYVKRLDNTKTDKRRVKKGVRMMTWKHISSNQLYKASKTFTDDNMKLVYVKDVYPKISDKSNAIIICDAFEKFSHSQILWEYIKEQNSIYGIPKTDLDSYAEYLELKDRKKDKQKDGMNSANGKDKAENKDKDGNVIADVKEPNKTEVVETVTEVLKINEVEPTNNTNSDIIFPDASVYKGNKGCDGYLNDKQFQAFENSLAQFKTDEEKAKICMEYVYTYCFNTAQVMKLGMMMDGETYRYVFFKTAYEKVYDRDNFLHVKQLLLSSKLKQGINEIYIVPAIEKPYAVGIDEANANNCAVSETDFIKIKDEIRKESFSTLRVDIAKRLIKQYVCLSAVQIKELLPLFSLEVDKVEIAKYSYQYCIDKKNYSVVTGFFTSAASKDQVTEYINKYTGQ